MCNARNHESGCECGFGPPYPGTIELVETIDWVDEAASSETAFKRRLEDLNLSRATINSFLQEYDSIQGLHEPDDTMRERVKRLVGRLEYRVEDSKFLPIKVPLFKLHSPSVKKAKVIYRELDIPEKEKGWWVKVFGIGTGPTKTLRVNYNPDFVSERGDCVQVYVPLVLNVRSIGVYKAGVLQNRGLSAEIEGIKDEGTLRKRGAQSLPEDECADRRLLGEYETLNFALSKQKGTKLENFKRNLKFDTARTVELQLVKVFGDIIKPLADVKHQQQIELEFFLPGSHDYHLCYGPGGLHWDVA